METKELKVQVPEGYEIDKENSILECIRFKPIKKDITYKDVCKRMFKSGYFITERAEIIEAKKFPDNCKIDANNATNKKQLERLLALNQLLNITEYYNKKHPKQDDCQYCITFEDEYGYIVRQYDTDDCLYGVVALFHNNDDTQAVIDNPNFREILDTVYKD